MTRRNREWRTVRIDAAVIAPLDNLVKTVKDELGMPVFKNRSDAVTQALQEFLKKPPSRLKVSHRVTKALKPKKRSEEGRNQANNSQHSAGAS